MGQWITKQEIKPKGFKNMEYLKNLIRPLVIREKLSLPVGKYIREVEIEPSKKLLEAYDSAKRKANNPSAKYHAARQFLCDTTREEFEDNPKITELENIYQQTTGKILIFSFYKCTVRMLKKYFDDRGIKCLTVMGGDGEDPTVTIKKFRESPDIQFLCATDRINAAQNIQCAKFIINWEKPLKPTVLDQRIGRVYRTGCDHDVHIVNFTVLDTVEEVISNNFASKQAVIDAAIEKLDQRALDSVNKEIEAAVMKEFGGGSLSED
jgi:SNF2 family DNA or RNA helicase